MLTQNIDTVGRAAATLAVRCRSSMGRLAYEVNMKRFLARNLVQASGRQGCVKTTTPRNAPFKNHLWRQVPVLDRVPTTTTLPGVSFAALFELQPRRPDGDQVVPAGDARSAGHHIRHPVTVGPFPMTPRALKAVFGPSFTRSAGT